MNMDELLQKAVNEIVEKEREILNDFAKAYLAAMSLTESHDIAWLLKNLVLNQQQVNEEGKFGYRYWYSLKDEPSFRYP